MDANGFMIGAYILVGLLVVFVVISRVVEKRKYEKANPYIIKYYKWIKGITGDPSWPVQKMGWFETNKLRAPKNDIPKVGDVIDNLPISVVNIDGNSVSVFIGLKGESNVDAYNARREELIKNIAKGLEISKTDRIMYDLV